MDMYVYAENDHMAKKRANDLKNSLDNSTRFIFIKMLPLKCIPKHFLRLSLYNIQSPAFIILKW